MSRRGGAGAGSAALLAAFLVAACETPQADAPQARAPADSIVGGVPQAIGPETEPDVPQEIVPQQIVREIEAGTGAVAETAAGPAPEPDFVESEAASARRERPRRDPEADLRLAEARRQIGLELEAAGDIEAAVSEFEAALAARWSGAVRDTPWGDLARICRRGEPAEAVARACTRVITPKWFAPGEIADFIANRGDAHARLGEHDRALSDYRVALEIDSSQHRALLGRARLQVRAGNPAAALNDLRLAIAVGPRPAEARLERAQAYRLLGERERAVADYDAVLADSAAAPFHSAAWRGRAETHCAMGRADAAAVDWQVWADSVRAGAGYLQEMLRARRFLRGPRETGIGPATLAALRAWTREGCP